MTTAYHSEFESKIQLFVCVYSQIIIIIFQTKI